MLGLPDVPARLLEKAHDVMVVQCIEDHPPGPASANQAHVAQQAKLVRDGRFREADERGQIADAQLFL